MSRFHLSSSRTGRGSCNFTLEAKTRSQSQFVLEAFNTFPEFGPSKGHRVHKYYAYYNSVKFLLIYVVFTKEKIIYFCKNQCISTRTIITNRSAIIFQAEKAAPIIFIDKKHFYSTVSSTVQNKVTSVLSLNVQLEFKWWNVLYKMQLLIRLTRCFTKLFFSSLEDKLKFCLLNFLFDL